ncbi:MAG: retropepsin-like aspartic protease [Ferruginibacter sp.]
MKGTLLWLVTFSAQLSFSQTKLSSSLKQLSQQNQFAKMDNLNKKVNNKDYYLYKAIFANVCNKPEISILYLDSLKNNYIGNTYEFAKLKYDNYIKLFNYDKAYSMSRTLTSTFQKHFTKAELIDEINAQRIWKTVRNKPTQYIGQFSTIILRTSKDMAGLTTTMVSANNTISSFVFDTGAGISCITETIANKMNVMLMPGKNITVQSLTGQGCKIKVGMTPYLNIGDLKLKNVLFLVYPDSAFTFGNGAYTINGIIGFPIIKELGTIIIEKERITCSKILKAGSNERNLFVDQLRAIIMLTYEGKTIPFNFDSGAKTSLFNKSFYQSFQVYLDSIGIMAINKASGAGAKEVVTNVLQVKGQTLYLNQKKIQIPVMTIDKNNYGVYGKVNYGNIGQDLIGQYKKLTISFDQNYVELEN